MGKCIHNRQPHSCSACKPESVFKIYQRVARKRGIRFDLTLEQFVALVVGRVCVYCGEGSDALGLDRIDSRLPYTPENVVPACKLCNKFKSAENKYTFLTHVLKIARYQEKLKNQKLPAPPPKPQPEQVPSAQPRVYDPSIPLEARRFLEGV